MFTGSGPGAGKSSLSRFLAEQLTLHGIETEWLYEEDVFTFEPIYRFGEQTFTGDLRAADSFLEGARLITEAWRGTSAVRITDSYLPGFYWLLHLYPKSQVEELMADIWTRIQTFQPLLVYCHADVRVAHRRAVAQRGERWGVDITRGISGIVKPRYPGPPTKDQEDVFAFLTWLDQSCREMVEKWPGDVMVLETTSNSLAAVQTQLLDRLNIQRLQSPSSQAVKALDEYAGTYYELPSREASEPLYIHLSNGQLFATLYWPAGSPLVWQEADLFRLESTSRTVKFNRDESASVCGLEYRFWNGSQQYSRRPKSDRL
jgi:hypothetical protein